MTDLMTSWIDRKLKKKKQAGKPTPSHIANVIYEKEMKSPEPEKTVDEIPKKSAKSKKKKPEVSKYEESTEG